MKQVHLNRINALIEQKSDNDDFSPVSISFRTFNETAKSGGSLKYYDSVTFLPVTSKKINKSKNPLHAYNRTRNIKLPDGSIKKVHLDFIVSINDFKIIL